MNSKERVIQLATLLIAIGLTGMAFGYLIAREQSSPASANVDDHAHDDEAMGSGDSHADHAESDAHAATVDHVELTAAALENLEIRVATVRKSEFVRELNVPGEITSTPGYGKRIVAASIDGVVDSIAVVQGQSVKPTDALATLKIIDQEFSTTQMSLLKNENRLTVIDRELVRLSGLAASGAIAKQRMRDLSYEKEQLLAERVTLTQSLRFRGLRQSHFDAFLQQGKLVDAISLVASSENTSSQSRLSEPSFYVVDSIDVAVGQTVKRGDAVCTLTNQSELYIRGLAFESDFEVVNRLYADQAPILIDFSHDPSSHGSSQDSRRIPISFVESTVDSRTQSLHFYLRLTNDIIGQRQDADGTQFNSWRYRPGQRVHLRLPRETWADQWKLPADAVVMNGAESLVFRRTVAVGDRLRVPGVSPFKRPKSDHAEFEPVSVRVRYRDDRYAVIEDDGNLAVGDQLVMSNAYQVQLAMERSSGGGGGGHDHAGHNH